MKKIALLNDTDKETLRNYLVGGALTGGGLAAAIELIRNMRTESTPIDDDLIEERRQVTLPEIKKVATEGPSILGPGAGMVLAGGAAVGSYALVRKLWTEIERRRALKELEEAQQEFGDSLSHHSGAEGQAKFAATDERRAPTGTELMTGIPVGLLALLMLGSGAASYSLLKEKAGPAGEQIKLKDNAKPPQMVMRRDTDGDGTPDTEETVSYNDKLASITPVLVRGMALDLCACHPNSDTARLVRQVADYAGYVKFASLVAAQGWFDTLEMVLDKHPQTKVANTQAITERDMLVATMLATEPMTKSAFALLAAADTAHADPTSFHAASQLSAPMQNALCKFAADVSTSEVLSHLMPGADTQAPAGEQQQIPLELLMQLMGGAGQQGEGQLPAGEEAQGDQAGKDDLVSGAPQASDIKDQTEGA